LELNLRKELAICYILGIVCTVLKFGHSGKEIRNTWKVLKCGAGEGCRRSVGTKNYYTESKRRGIS
jgi:hypothetical protein